MFVSLTLSFLLLPLRRSNRRSSCSSLLTIKGIDRLIERKEKNFYCNKRLATAISSSLFFTSQSSFLKCSITTPSLSNNNSKSYSNNYSIRKSNSYCSSADSLSPKSSSSSITTSSPPSHEESSSSYLKTKSTAKTKKANIVQSSLQNAKPNTTTTTRMMTTTSNSNLYDTTSLPLSLFLWKESYESTFVNKPSPTTMVMFTLNNLGSYILDRKRVTDEILNNIAEQQGMFDHYETGVSIYLHGCRGMGKTSVLMFMAKILKDQGYIVYFFTCLSSVPLHSEFEIMRLLEDNKDKKFAFIIDSASSNKYAPGAMHVLLRGRYPNLVVI